MKRIIVMAALSVLVATAAGAEKHRVIHYDLETPATCASRWN